MGIHDTIKAAINDNKSEIEKLQWSLSSAVASIVYSRYLASFKNKMTPRRMILVPQIKQVTKLLSMNGGWANGISSDIIDTIKRQGMLELFSHAPEIQWLMNMDEDILNTLIEFYIMPNVGRVVPECISRKFQLGDTGNQMFFEDSTIDMYPTTILQPTQLEYIAMETMINFVLLSKSIDKSVAVPDQNRFFTADMKDFVIVCINHQNAICPIYINGTIASASAGVPNEILRDILFVTNTQMTIHEDSNYYTMTSSPENDITIIRLQYTNDI